MNEIQIFCKEFNKEPNLSYTRFWAFPDFIRKLLYKNSIYGLKIGKGSKSMLKKIIEFYTASIVTNFRSVLPNKFKSLDYDLIVGKFKLTPVEKKYLSIIKLKEKPEIVIYGKIRRQSRDVTFFSETSEGYIYSEPLTPILKSIMNRLNHHFESNYNGILINRYNDGTEYISSHSDDESGLGEKGVIAISLGATRNFRIRKKTRGKGADTIIANIPNRDGEILIMAGNFQKYFTHEIPIQKTVKNPRTSLTFRHHNI